MTVFCVSIYYCERKKSFVSIMSKIFFVLFVLPFIASCTSVSLLNEKVATHIDVSSQLVMVSYKITVKNQCSENIESYSFIVDPQWMHNLSYIGAKDENKNSLSINKVDTDGSWLKYEILFNNPLAPDEIKRIEIFSVIINYLLSYPKAVKQNEIHTVMFSFNIYYYSSYFTQIQTTQVHVGTNQVTVVDGATYKIGDSPNYGLQYGPYMNIDPMSEYPSIIHYTNKSPFLTVEKLERFIKISHWGYLTIWEHISLLHTGPKFIGPYERHASTDTPDTRIESFTTTLPGNAFDIYLKDEIGRLSSFEVDDSLESYVKVTIKPRFLLYGGWKTRYEIGYTLPISDYVSYQRGTSLFTLSIPLVAQIYSKMIIKEAEINIILPEGARFQDINPYFELENNTENRYCYYLDIICREVVSFKKYNLIDLHAINVSFKYSFNQILLLSKPIVIFIFCYILLLLFLVRSYTTTSILPKGEVTLQSPVTNSIPTLPKQEQNIKNKKKTQNKLKSKKC